MVKIIDTIDNNNEYRDELFNYNFDFFYEINKEPFDDKHLLTKVFILMGFKYEEILIMSPKNCKLIINERMKHNE